MKSIFLKITYSMVLSLTLLACGGGVNEMAEEELALQTTDTTAALAMEMSGDSLINTDSTSLAMLEKEPTPDSVAPALSAPPKLPKTNVNLPEDLAQINKLTHKGFLTSQDSSRLLKIEVYLEKVNEKKYRGFYLYEGKTARIFLEGTINSKGVLNLVERINGKETGMFRLKVSEGEQWNYISEWTNPDGNSTYKVYLQSQ